MTQDHEKVEPQQPQLPQQVALAIKLSSIALSRYNEPLAVNRMRAAISLLEFDDFSERGRLALKIITLLTDASTNVPMFVLRHLLNFLTFALAIGFAPVGSKQDREQLITGLEGGTASGEQRAVVRLNSIADKVRDLLRPEVFELAALVLTDALEQESLQPARPLPMSRLIELAFPGSPLTIGPLPDTAPEDLESDLPLWRKKLAERLGNSEEIVELLRNDLLAVYGDCLPWELLAAATGAMLDALEEAVKEGAQAIQLRPMASLTRQ